jgi:hypothetical protein
MANIRDPCSWVHMHEPERATAKAKDAVRMAVAKACYLTALQEMQLPVTPSALVIGGGNDPKQAVQSVIDRVNSHARITVHTEAQVTAVSGIICQEVSSIFPCTENVGAIK